MSKHQYYEGLNSFKDEVIKRLVYWNTIRFFLLFLGEGMILYGIIQMLALFTVIYNHVWAVGILTCVAVLAWFYLNVGLIGTLMTAHGRIEPFYADEFDRHFVLCIRMFISFVSICVAYGAVDYIIKAVLTVVSFAIVMEILFTIMFVGSIIFCVMYLVVDWLISARRDENWWCDEMEALFKKKTADDAAKGLIKENRSIIKGQYDR